MALFLCIKDEEKFCNVETLPAACDGTVKLFGCIESLVLIFDANVMTVQQCAKIIKTDSACTQNIICKSRKIPHFTDL